MPLKLIKETDQLEWFPIFFDSQTQDPWPTNENNEPLNGTEVIEVDDNFSSIDGELNIEVALFGLKRLSSGVMTKISNSVYKVNRKGHSSFQYGTASVQKVLAACKRVKNVEHEGESNFNEKTLNSLPQWIFDRLLEKVNEMNSLMEDDELD